VYLALRCWTLLIRSFPIELNLRSARIVGRVWWRCSRRHRERALEHLRTALGADYSEAQLADIGRRSFEHLAEVYLVEFLQTGRLVNVASWSRYIELDELGPALREILSDRGVILLTAHFGNFELLGYALTTLGLPLTALMRPLDNEYLTRYVVRARDAGGLRLIFKRGAAEESDRTLKAGGALCFIADQDAGRKAVFADFFGRPAAWYKSIGLLAMHHRVPIVVGAAYRTRPGFHYRIAVNRIIQPEEWDAQREPLRWLTQEYARALEELIRRAPEQYLWIHRRWKTRPPEERAALAQQQRAGAAAQGASSNT
jgi:KDO2-lipid IV(A) lauroyltransferase